jgi:hypothetical protein
VDAAQLPTGSGEIRFASGARHVGSFLAGRRHGPGVYHYTNGSRLEGCLSLYAPC